jgi:hypothetical protein
MAQFKTYNLGLTIKQPLPGSIGYFQGMDVDTYAKLSAHDHTGSGKGVQIGTNGLAAGAVTNSKIGEPILIGNGGTGASDFNGARAALGFSPLLTWTPTVTPNSGAVTPTVLEAFYAQNDQWIEFQVSISILVDSGSPTILNISPPAPSTAAHNASTIFLARAAGVVSVWRYNGTNFVFSKLSGAAFSGTEVISIDGKYRYAL